MARGWESKNVEDQQAEAERRRSQVTRKDLTPEERQREGRRQELRLAIARTQAELAAACRPAHRDMLRLRLEALQQQLQHLP